MKLHLDLQAQSKVHTCGWCPPFCPASSAAALQTPDLPTSRPLRPASAAGCASCAQAPESPPPELPLPPPCAPSPPRRWRLQCKDIHVSRSFIGGWHGKVPVLYPQGDCCFTTSICGKLEKFQHVHKVYICPTISGGDSLPSASLALVTNSVRRERSHRWRRSPLASSASSEAPCVVAIWCKNRISRRAAAAASGQLIACLAFSCASKKQHEHGLKRDQGDWLFYEQEGPMCSREQVLRPCNEEED